MSALEKMMPIKKAMDLVFALQLITWNFKAIKLVTSQNLGERKHFSVIQKL